MYISYIHMLYVYVDILGMNLERRRAAQAVHDYMSDEEPRCLFL